MSEQFYIQDKQLPMSLDYQKLLEEALMYVQSHGGMQWTNLNTSDPGVTILDQVCYALTELGYCTQFPIEDILTEKNDKINFNDQFYKADEILTTAPVTAEDYIKLLVDSINEVSNASIKQLSIPGSLHNVYQVYLQLDFTPNNLDEAPNICQRAYHVLQQQRTMGEVFLMPKALSPKSVEIHGKLEIGNTISLSFLIKQLQEAFDMYIFPKLTGVGYDALEKAGVATNAIFNGPKLKHGWMVEQVLDEKKNLIRSLDISQLFQQISGVELVSQIKFGTGTDLRSVVTSQPWEVLEVSIPTAILKGTLLISKKGVVINAVSKNNPLDPNLVNQLSIAGSSMVQMQGVDTFVMEPKKPKGKYRDIDSYYSIQNTFPEIFEVGSHAPTSNTMPKRMAQSRQLKGFLTLIDQVLANQFAQLANVPALFSFKNTDSANSEEKKKLEHKETPWEKEHPMYPVPYVQFSPTYFVKPLYKVPNIRPLLKDTYEFYFSEDEVGKKVLEAKSWKEFCEDPYNSYIHGLMNFVGQEEIHLKRRESILDHLLARHGESPFLINRIIEGTQFTGERLKDRIILKSLYLQNIGKLSYRRAKASNVLQAKKIGTQLPKVSAKIVQKLEATYKKNFVFDSEKANRKARLKSADFANYSALELKLHLLLGLEFEYNRYIVSNFDKGTDLRMYVRQAQWLRTERKGFILIETQLLYASAEFELVFKSNTDISNYWMASRGPASENSPLRLDDVIRIENWIRSKNSTPFYISNKVVTEEIEGITYSFQKKQNFNWNNPIFSNTGAEGAISMKAKWADATEIYLGTGIFEDSIQLIFPKFITTFQSEAFRQRLNVILQDSLPISCTHRPYPHLLEGAELNNVLAAYAKWHNAMRFSKASKDPKLVSMDEQSALAGALVHQLSITLKAS